MVEILCPHCEGEIELDDDASGEFECPTVNSNGIWTMTIHMKPTPILMV